MKSIKTPLIKKNIFFFFVTFFESLQRAEWYIRKVFGEVQKIKSQLIERVDHREYT